MSFLPQNTDLGDLDPIEIYSYYNGPRLFSCQNSLGNIYLALWVDEEVDFDLWLYVLISQQRFEEIRFGRIDLQNAFLRAEDGFVFEVKTFFKINSDVAQCIAGDKIDIDWLPLPDDYLKIPSKDFSGANLSGFNLNNNLSGADLSNAYLIGVKMSGTNLSNVKVNQAKFEENVDLSEDIKLYLKRGGAIFEDSPGGRSKVITFQ